VSADLFEDRVRQGLTRGVPAAGSQVVLGGVDLEAGPRCDRRERLEAFGHHLRADAIAPDDRDIQRISFPRLNHAHQSRSSLASWTLRLT